MNIYQIDRVIRQHVRRFNDVFACDRLLTKPRLMVCHTDPSDMPGEHWIAIYVDDDGRYGEYFDPIGRAPTRVFEHYMNEHCCEWITGSAVALHCCKAHSKINRKMENSTPCKIVTPENFTLKLGTRDYVEEVTNYTIFDADRLSGGFSPNR